MLTWFMENMATIIISTVLLLAVAAVIVSMVRGKKKGKSSCGCSSCPVGSCCPAGSRGAMNDACHSVKTETLPK